MRKKDTANISCPCGNVFRPTIHRKKYCSRPCYHKYDDRYKEGETAMGYGVKRTEKQKKELSKLAVNQWKEGQFNDWLKRKRANPLRGRDHFNYRNGNGKIREKLYSLFEYKDWRTSVFKRDDYTCQKCGQRGGCLEAHHKTPFREIAEKHQFKDHLEAAKCEELFDVSNGITLCNICHGEVDEQRKRTLKKAA